MLDTKISARMMAYIVDVAYGHFDRHLEVELMR